MIYIVSSSFLTIGTHTSLRELILSTCKVVRIVKLHRATFPGIDIFPAIVELERCDDQKQRDANVYQFYDLWRLHPETHKADLKTAYATILGDLSAKKNWPFKDVLAKRYTVRQGALLRYSKKPIFEGLASLHEFMTDTAATTATVELKRSDASKVDVRFLTVRGRKVVKLKDIAEVKIGLQSGNNGRFYRAAAGVKGGATKGGYKEVPLAQIVTDADLAAMTDDERAEGIEVNDPSNDRYFVPLDKAGASDIDGGFLPVFWRPVEFYIDWSKQAVSDMKALKGAVFRNPQYYFRRGISFSNTGIYSPTYRLGHGGVFDQTGSNVFCDVLNQTVLLGILSSTLLKYFIKSFINHGVHAQLDDLPIVLPNDAEAKAIAAVVDEIITAQKASPAFDYRPKLAELDALIASLYDLNEGARNELSTWYRRHYPRLTGEGTEDA